MNEPYLDTPANLSAESLQAALSAVCCRFGSADREAERRGSVRALLASSKALSTALDQFVTRANPHARGEHNTGDLRTEGEALIGALVEWSFFVNATASLQERCVDSASRPRTGEHSITALSTPLSIVVSAHG